MRQVAAAGGVEPVLRRSEVERGLELKSVEPRQAGRVVAHGRRFVGAGDESSGLGGAAAAVLEEAEAGGRKRCRGENEEQEQCASVHDGGSLSPRACRAKIGR